MNQRIDVLLSMEWPFSGHYINCHPSITSLIIFEVRNGLMEFDFINGPTKHRWITKFRQSVDPSNKSTLFLLVDVLLYHIFMKYIILYYNIIFYIYMQYMYYKSTLQYLFWIPIISSPKNFHDPNKFVLKIKLIVL